MNQMDGLEQLDAKLIEINRIANLQANYDKTLLLLRALKSGQIEIDDFSMTEDGWNLSPKPLSFPMTIEEA